MADGTIDVTLFNGGIRTTATMHIAQLLRAKSPRCWWRFGSCAMEGCIPGLSNIKGADYALNRAYMEAPTTDNPNQVLPCPSYDMPEGEITLPALYKQLRPLEQVVPVDYQDPRLPAEPRPDLERHDAGDREQAAAAGSLLGVDKRTVCEQCPRVREGKIRVKRVLTARTR